jgi:hypothetical protein
MASSGFVIDPDGKLTVRLFDLPDDIIVLA